MSYIMYLSEAVDEVLEEMRDEYGDTPLWKYFKEAFDAVVDSIDENILSGLVERWYSGQAAIEGFEKAAVKNTVKRLAEGLMDALSLVYSIPEAELERVDLKAIDWKPLLEKLKDYGIGGATTEIAKEIGKRAGVTPKKIEKQVDEFAKYTEQEFTSILEDLKKLLSRVKEQDPQLYNMLLSRLEELLPRAGKSIAEASKRVELGELRAFMTVATELLKTVKEVMEEFKKTAEELRKAAAEKPAKPKAVKPIVKPVPIGETAKEQEYLNRLAEKWGWGYNPETTEFLAPLTVVWAVAMDRLDEHPDLREEAKMWIALNRYVWSRVIGFRRGFLEVEKEDFEWDQRFFDVMKTIESRSPELAELLTMLRSRDEVPTNIVYSLAENKLYELRITAQGPELGKEVAPRDLEKIISRRAAWLEEKEIKVEKVTPWAAGTTRVRVPRPERLLFILKGRCPVCNSEKLSTSQVYGPYNPPSANCAIVACYNCHTVYRLYGDGTAVIAPPTLDPDRWRERWENNPAKDERHPFTPDWVENVRVFAEVNGFRVEPQF
jgi:hypothetical protein